MARHTRRLITWIGGGILALLLLAALVLLALVWLVDPNVWRARIAKTAGDALGRQVTLGGDLHWDIGWNIAIASEGGTIANAAGFDGTPFASWQRMRLGLNARALLGKRIEVDQLAIEGLQVNLQRNAAGMGNWTFASKNSSAEEVATKPIPLRIAALQLRNSRLTFSDARDVVAPASATRWQLDQLALDMKLPPDLNAPLRELRDVALQGQLLGGPLPAMGIAIGFETASLKQDAEAGTLVMPAFKAQWADAGLAGSVNAAYGASPAAQAKLALRVPSVRALLASLAITPPPMADPSTLGRLGVDGNFDLKGSTLAVTALHAVLDDTQLDGSVSITQFAPLVLRFDLTGNAIDFDRYLEPADYKGKPFELPLAQLKALNVQGVLQMKSATVMGAKATELRIDVE